MPVEPDAPPSVGVFFVPIGIVTGPLGVLITIEPEGVKLYGYDKVGIGPDIGIEEVLTVAVVGDGPDTGVDEDPGGVGAGLGGEEAPTDGVDKLEVDTLELADKTRNGIILSSIEPGISTNTRYEAGMICVAVKAGPTGGTLASINSELIALKVIRT